MMNLKAFVVSIFTSRVSQHLNGQLDVIRQSAAADAALVADTYLNEFEATLADRLSARQKRLIGVDVGGSADAGVATVATNVRGSEDADDAATATVPETRLMRQMKQSVKIAKSEKSTAASRKGR